MFASPPRPRPRPARRRRGPLLPTIAILAGVAIVVVILSRVWTEALWFDQLGYLRVLWIEWGTRAVLFVAGFAVMAIAVAGSLRFAYHARPVYAPSTPEQTSLDQYREAIEPLRRLVMLVGPVLLGLFAGGAAAQRWDTVQLAMHAQRVGTTDPQFYLDLGFYMFTLPLLR
ncbi:MAG: hypothetical protein B7X40_07385, partial [Cellulomonas sp. 14-74-6]